MIYKRINSLARAAESRRGATSRLLLITLLLCTFAGGAKAVEVEIGDGNVTDYYTPIGTYYNYSITEQLYTADEIGMAGTITSVSFSYAGTTAKDFPIKVYMKHVDASDLSSAGISLVDEDEVFEGTLSVTEAGWATIDLYTPFAYDGSSNLLIGVIKGYVNWYSNGNWNHTTTTVAMARYTQSDNNAYTTSTVPGTTSTKRPNIQLDITPSEGPIYYSPAYLAATLTPGNGSVATLSWTQKDAVTAWVLEYGTAEDFMGATSVNVSGTPSCDLTGLTSETTYYARVKADYGSGNESNWSRTCVFTPTDAFTLTVNDGTTASGYAPINGFWADNTQRSEFIIPASTLNTISDCVINSMKFYANYDFTSTGSFQVYLKEVDESSFSGTDFYTAEGATTVYTGTLTVSSTDGMTITFDDGYEYKGGNLLIGFYEASGGNCSGSSATFYGVEATGASISFMGTNSVAQRNFLPKVTFEYSSSTYPAPKSLTVNDLTDNTATIGWTAPNTDVTGYQYRYKTANGSWTDLASTTELSASLTGLTPNTSYTFQVKAIYSDGESAFSAITFTTDCSAHPIPYTFGFETAEIGDLDCWTIINVNNRAHVSNGSGFSSSNPPSGHGGDQFFVFSYYDYPDTNPQYMTLISPELTGMVNGLHVEFYYLTDGGNYSETFRVGYSTTDKSIGSFIWNSSITRVAADYELFRANFPAGTKYVAVQHLSDDKDYLILDDFSFTEAPSCIEPTNVQVSGITTSGAALSWAAGGGESACDIYVTDDIADVPDDATTPTYPNVTANTNYLISGLVSGTTYYVYLRSACDATTHSDWTMPTTFNTVCEAISLPYSYDFEDNALPICWNTMTSDAGWNIFTISDTDPQHGSKHLDMYCQNTGTQYVVLTEVDASYPLNEYEITFYSRLSGSNTTGRTLAVGIMTDPYDETTFEQIGDAFTPTTAYSRYKVRFDAYTGNGQYIAIKHTISSTGNTYIDNLEVKHIPSCIEPDALACTATTAHGATISWTAGDSSQTAWQIYYSENDTDPEDDIDVSLVTAADSNPFTISSGLDAETTYYAWVRGNCTASANGYSTWVGPVSFTTAVACPAPTDLAATNISGHTAQIGWTGYSDSYNVSYRTAAYAIGFDEKFGTSSIPTGWTRYSTLLTDDVLNGTTALSSATSGWSFSTSNGVFDSHAKVNIYGTNCKYWLVTPATQIADGRVLSFDMALTAYSGTNVPASQTTGTDDRFVVLISTDYNSTEKKGTWTILRQWDNAGSAYVYNNITSSATGENVTIDLSSYAGQNAYIAFYGESTTSNADNNLHIDNVAIGTPVAAGAWQSETVTDETTTLTGLDAETKYEVKVQGNCDGEGSSLEITLFFTTDVACPAPTGLAAGNPKSSSIDLSWTSYADAWQICVNDDETNLINIDVSDVTVDGTTIQYTLTGLTEKTDYTVKVRSNCGGEDGVSDWTSEVNFTTLESCAKPTNVVASNISQNAADITWTGDSEEFTVSYRTAGVIDGLEEEFNTSSIPDGWTSYSGLVDQVIAGTATLSSTTSNGWNLSNTYVFGKYHTRLNIYGTSCRYWLVTPEVTLASGSALRFDMALTDYNSANGLDVPDGQADDRFVVLITTDNGAIWTVLREWNNSGSAYVYNDIATAGEKVNIDLSSYSGAVKIAFYGESTVSGTSEDNDLHIDNVTIGAPVGAGAWQTVTATGGATMATLSGLTMCTKYDVKVSPSCNPTNESDITTFTTTGVIDLALDDDGTDNGTLISNNDGYVANVTLSDRTLYQDGYWNTLCLPFDIDNLSGTPLAGATVMELRGDNSDLTDGTLTLNFTDATSIEAGKPYIIKWDQPTSDLTISSVDDWNNFASAVAGGNTYAGKLVRLTNDITVSTKVGSWKDSSNNHVFSGTFDGDGHTLTLDLTGSAQGCAPFGGVAGATILNLNTTGTVKPQGNTEVYHASGLVGFANGVTIKNCHVHADILFPTTATTVHSGGIIGHALSAPFTMTNCLFDGSIYYDETSTNTMTNVGGLVGWDDASTPNITYCLNDGTFANPSIISKIARVNNRGTISNCYSTTNASSDGSQNDNRGAYTTNTGSDLQQLLGSGWQVSGTTVVPKKSTVAANIENPVFTGVTIDATPNDVEISGGKVTFKGSYDYQSFTGEDKSILFLGSDNKLYWPQSGAGIGACRAYFQLNNGITVGDITATRLFFDDEEASGIATTNYTNRTNSDGAWYDMQGRRVKSSIMKKGLYIVNGRKVVVK